MEASGKVVKSINISAINTPVLKEYLASLLNTENDELT
jgi:hypothetical protein